MASHLLMPVMDFTMEVTHNIVSEKEKPVLNPHEVTHSMISSRLFTLGIVPHQGTHSLTPQFTLYIIL